MPAVNSVPASPFPLPLILSTTGFEPDFFRGSARKGDQGAGRPAARAGETMHYRALECQGGSRPRRNIAGIVGRIFHEEAVEAYGDILADPDILPWIEPGLEKLLEAPDSAGQPGVLEAILESQNQAVSAYRRVLERPVFNNIINALDPRVSLHMTAPEST